MIFCMVECYILGGGYVQLKVAVCEDEKITSEYLCEQISEIKPEYIIETYLSGEELLLSDTIYDIIFLDIEMPGRNGMDIAKELRERKCSSYIVFMTSHTEFMPEAFKVKAFRFLEKPINQKKIEEALVGAEKEICSDESLVLKEVGNERAVDTSKIIYIESCNNKTIVHTTEDTFETYYTLKDWCGQLSGEEFVQVHKFYIVSMRYVKKIEDNNMILRESEIKIPVSRRNIKVTKDAFYNYIRQNARCM